jgi:hypothetical protein
MNRDLRRTGNLPAVEEGMRKFVDLQVIDNRCKTHNVRQDLQSNLVFALAREKSLQVDHAVSARDFELFQIEPAVLAKML